jgi:hypothetical protein
MSCRIAVIVVGLLFLVLYGCSTSNDCDCNCGNLTLPVVVTDYTGSGVPNATVVLGDSNGVM